ncbi:uncharacterized protein [Mycetomoellerius zeteki]|uniref:uncharacterized protein n=1 Tax=Mycetomoellerius zeteki TaxID=64791 RepID=UPI00084E5B65|nr:PREDICTED: uncharacterized protein LOC108728993 [Trachymyrmex zeteki]
MGPVARRSSHGSLCRESGIDYKKETGYRIKAIPAVQAILNSLKVSASSASANNVAQFLYVCSGSPLSVCQCEIHHATSNVMISSRCTPCSNAVARLYLLKIVPQLL